MENTCKTLIENGIFLRYISTIIFIYVLSRNINNNTIKKYIYLILFISLILLDFVDNIPFLINKKTNCYKNIYYDIQDKICDSISYILLFFVLKYDPYLLFFNLYRIIGVILLSLTKNNNYMIIFFDFIKEYLLYLFIFGKNYSYISIFIVSKIIFEYWRHKIYNIIT